MKKPDSYEKELKNLLDRINKKGLVVLFSVVDFSLAPEGEEIGYRMEEATPETVQVINPASSKKEQAKIDKELKTFDRRKK